MSVIVPASLNDALQALARSPHATLLAGGTDLMVELNGGHRQVSEVVALARVAELRTWHHDPVAGVLHIGAGVTYAEIADEPIASWVPALAQAARTVGSPQIRHAATIGGNLGTCSPAGDGLPVLAALDARAADGPEGTNLSPAAAGPMAAEEAWRSYRTDGAMTFVEYFGLQTYQFPTKDCAMMPIANRKFCQNGSPSA